MTTTRLTIAAALFAAASLTSARAGDIAGAADHPLVGRYVGSEMFIQQKSDFDRVDLLSAALPQRFSSSAGIPDASRLTVEGKSFRYVYNAPADRSALEIDANFAQSLAAKGFETLFACADRACISGSSSFYEFGALLDDVRRNGSYQKAVQYRLAKLARPSGDVYAAILVGAGGRQPVVAVRVVELKPMEADRIVFVDASAMKAGIDTTGHVALYGILFDTDKADIKPESRPTLAEIAKLLAAQPGLRLVVAGHTDGQGEFDYNVGLSRRRAEAVVRALVEGHGVAAGRLTPFGAGMAAPVALNDTDQGRARNRRVELVKR
jgi:OmpA-OmpF porin, OOP family